MDKKKEEIIREMFDRCLSNWEEHKKEVEKEVKSKNPQEDNVR